MTLTVPVEGRAEKQNRPNQINHNKRIEWLSSFQDFRRFIAAVFLCKKTDLSAAPNSIYEKGITTSGSGNPTKRRTAFFVTSSGIYDRGITMSGNK